jgi:CRP-like cAMP-binding protein
MMAEPTSDLSKYVFHYDVGAHVFREGDEGNAMYVIQSGKIAIQKRINGKKTTLSVLAKGDFFGEMSLLESHPRAADAEVVEACSLIVINAETFIEMIRDNPAIAVRMLRKYSSRLRQAVEQMDLLMDAPSQAASPTLAGKKKAAPPGGWLPLDWYVSLS